MGLVMPLMPSFIPGYPEDCSLSIEITKRMEAVGAVGEDKLFFDPTMLKFILEDMATESECKILYHSTPIYLVKEGNCITHLIVYNKDGISAYKTKYAIDCTGDADLAVMAGAEFESGDADRINQPVSLRFEMAGIDFNAFHAYMHELGNDFYKYFAMNSPGMAEILSKAADDGILTSQDIKYFQAFGIPGKPDSMNFNCPELTPGNNAADAAFLTKKQLEGKRAILRLQCFLKERIPGFKNAYITGISDMVGIRESRRINTEYTLTTSDILDYRKFEDGITACAYPIDIHGKDDTTLGVCYNETIPEPQRYWEVPFRCMIPKKLNNLLVSGRCAGFDFVAQSAARIQLVCRAMGEAAGIGCALAAENQSAFLDINTAEVKRLMKQRIEGRNRVI